jgi:hypothetical protein
MATIRLYNPPDLKNNQRIYAHKESLQFCRLKANNTEILDQKNDTKLLRQIYKKDLLK